MFHRYMSAKNAPKLPNYNNFLLLYADKMLGKQKSFMFRQHYIKLIKFKKILFLKLKTKNKKTNQLAQKIDNIYICVSNKKYAYLRIEYCICITKITSNHKFFINGKRYHELGINI